MTKPYFTPNGAMLVLAIAILAASGCTSLTNKMSLPTWGGTSSPTQIVATWNPVIRQEDGKAIRGFAAKVMFYDTSSGSKAMRVRGNFDVYAYDEDNPAEDRVTPTRIIQYQVDNLKNLESDSKIYGKSYTIWVPWDDATMDAKKKNISLIVRFRCKDGTMVMSHQAKVSLPSMGAPEDVDETIYVNPYAEEKKQQMDRLYALAAQHRDNPNSFDTEWNDSVAEYVLSRDNRPEGMLTRTINMPGVSRNGVVPNITPTQTFASASDEQKYMARLMIANAQNAMNQPANPVAINQLGQNQGFPINQVGYQSTSENGQVYQQPMLQPNTPPMFQQQLPPTSQGLVPMSDEAKYQEFLNWQRQQAMQQQPSQQQPPQQQPPQQQPPQQQPVPQPFLGNYAAANTGTTRR